MIFMLISLMALALLLLLECWFSWEDADYWRREYDRLAAREQKALRVFRRVLDHLARVRRERNEAREKATDYRKMLEEMTRLSNEHSEDAADLRRQLAEVSKAADQWSVSAVEWAVNVREMAGRAVADCRLIPADADVSEPPAAVPAGLPL